MPIYFLLIVAAAGIAGLGVVSFRAPAGVYRKACLGLLAGIGAPAVGAYFLSPFFGSGSGLGIAFLLYFWWTAVVAAALSAVLGASLRHLWNFLDL